MNAVDINALAAFGANFNPDILAATRALYAPLVRKHDWGRIKVVADIAYGPDARQKLDLYQPAQRSDRTLIYIPGGAFIGGDKNADGVFYPNLGHYFALHGVLTIVANYRLAPTHQWPSGITDIASVIAWAHAHVREFGGNSERIILFGQSAGASHSAGYLFNTKFHPSSGSGIVAAILMSGSYRVAAGAAANVRAYYGDDASTYAERSPLTHVAKSRTPLLLSVAEYDPAYLAAPTYELAHAVTLRDGKSPHVIRFAGHNHVSTVMSLGTGQDDVGAALRDFIDAVP